MFPSVSHACACLLFAASLAVALEIHVAPTGNDTIGTGSAGAPFASIVEAQTEVRERIAAGLSEDISVVLHDGTYRVTEPLLFTPRDCAPSYTITWQAANSGQAIASGGFEVSGWTESGGRLTAVLPEGTKPFRSLYVNGRRAIRCRAPNVGDFHRVAGQDPSNPRYAFYFHEGDIDDGWANLTDINLVIYRNWLATRHYVKTVDAASSYITFDGTAWQDIGTQCTNRPRYYVENCEALLDTAGEWYYDESTRVLSYLPRDGEQAADIVAVVPQVDRLVSVQGDLTTGSFVTGLVFDGIVFAHTDWAGVGKNASPGQAHCLVNEAAVYARGMQGGVFRRCEITCAGAHGVVLHLGSTDNTFEQCRIHRIGGGGVYIAETGGWNSGKVHSGDSAFGANTVTNCFIHDLSEVWHGSVGVLVGVSEGNTISHNEIMNNDYTGISVGWDWQYRPGQSAANTTVEYNRIHHIMNGLLSDGAGIYTLGDLAGSILRGNVIHDVRCFRYHGDGIYLDQGSSHLTVEDNLVYNVRHAGFFYHNKGSNNTVRNNIFAATGNAGVLSGEQDDLEFTFERNIVLTGNGVAASSKVDRPERTRFDYNCYWDPYSGRTLDFGCRTWQQWQALGQDNNSIVADPGFADPSSGDFSLRAGSPIDSVGFVPFDLSQAGLTADAAWRTLPSSVAPAAVYEHTATEQLVFNANSVTEGFEERNPYELPEGMSPGYWTITGVNSAGLYITDERAHTGNHSLVMVDDPDARMSYDPFFAYPIHWYGDSGVITLAFDVFFDGPGELRINGRDPAGKNGINYLLEPGTGGVSGGRWVHVETVWDVTASTYELRIDGAGSQRTIAADFNGCISQVLFIGSGTQAARMYIDDLAFTFARALDTVSVQEPVFGADHREGLVPGTPRVRGGRLHLPKGVGWRLYSCDGRMIADVPNEAVRVGYSVPLARGLLIAVPYGDSDACWDTRALVRVRGTR